MVLYLSLVFLFHMQSFMNVTRNGRVGILGLRKGPFLSYEWKRAHAREQSPISFHDCD